VFSDIADSSFLVTNSLRRLLAAERFNKIFSLSRDLVGKLHTKMTRFLHIILITFLPVNASQNSFVDCEIVFCSEWCALREKLKNKDSERPVVSCDVVTGV